MDKIKKIDKYSNGNKFRESEMIYNNFHGLSTWFYMNQSIGFQETYNSNSKQGIQLLFIY